MSKGFDNSFKFPKRRGFEVAKGFEDKNINLPKRATKKAAGYDFESSEDVVIPVGSKPVLVPTGVKSYMGDQEVLVLANRSSNPLKKGLVLTNGIGVIDADYYSNESNDGHIMGQFINVGKEDVVIKKGERVFQGIFLPFLLGDNDIPGQDRTGGHGSTN